VASRLPALRPERIVRALQGCGLVIKRQTGSHVILVKVGLQRPVVVAMHQRELPRGTVADILKQAQVSIDEFVAHI
jgi:predicted RNA binding protein YcfA (HicA-like mRNA interferase family)